MHEGIDLIGDRIVLAAATLFTQDGFERASTAAIARAAKTSKREIYKRFPNKEKLFESVMHYLCALSDDPPEPPVDEEVSFEVIAKTAALAVISRFSQPETRGVLVAAIAAKPNFPSIIKIFWDEGPGQAVTAIANAIEQENGSGRLNVPDPHARAHRFILDCCGPMVTGQLFDSGYTLTKEAIFQHIDMCYENMLTQAPV